MSSPQNPDSQQIATSFVFEQAPNPFDRILIGQVLSRMGLSGHFADTIEASAGPASARSGSVIPDEVNSTVLPSFKFKDIVSPDTLVVREHFEDWYSVTSPKRRPAKTNYTRAFNALIDGGEGLKYPSQSYIAAGIPTPLSSKLQLIKRNEVGLPAFEGGGSDRHLYLSQYALFAGELVTTVDQTYGRLTDGIKVMTVRVLVQAANQMRKQLIEA